jgi:lysophospholipase L1-like esterase
MTTLVLATIVALGDSVTLGARKDRSVTTRQAFPALLEALLKERVINAGIGGNDTRQMLDRLTRDVLSRRPRVVLVMAGLNDAARVDPGGVARQEPRIPVDEYERNLTALVRRSRAARASIVILTPNPMTRQWPYQTLPFYQIRDINDGLVPYAEAARRVARLNNACLVDVFAAWIADSQHQSWLPDGIHPDPEGHRKIAGLVMERCAATFRPPIRKRSVRLPPPTGRGTKSARTKESAGGSSPARK